MNMTVDAIIRMMLIISTLPFVMSVKMSVKLRNGTMERSALDSISTMKAIILGKKEINVIGVRAL